MFVAQAPTLYVGGAAVNRACWLKLAKHSALGEEPDFAVGKKLTFNFKN